MRNHLLTRSQNLMLDNSLHSRTLCISDLGSREIDTGLVRSVRHDCPKVHRRCLCMLVAGALLIQADCFAKETDAEPASIQTGVRLQQELRRVIRQKTATLSRDEFQAIRQLLEWYQSAPLDVQERIAAEGASAQSPQDEKLAKGRALFPEVFRHPERYVGSSMAIRGTVRRLEQVSTFPQAAEDLNLQSLGTYEAWVYTSESQHNPWVILCQQIPSGITTGKDLQEGVQFTGLFVKLVPYTARDGRRLAPLVVGQQLLSITTTSPRRLSGWWSIAIVVTCVGLTVLWIFSRRRERRLQQLLRARLETPPQFLDNLPVTPETDPESRE